MVVYKFILVWVGLWAGLFIMKDLLDFIAVGKELGHTGDKLEKYAETKYEAYLKAIEREAQVEAEKAENLAQKNYERDMRVLEKREKVAEAERSAVTESAGSGGAFLTPCPIIQIYTLL